MARSNRNSRTYRDDNYRDRGLKEQTVRKNRNQEKHLIRDYSGLDFEELQDQFEELEEAEEMDS